MRILVCGGRTFSDTKLLTDTLDGLAAERGPIECIIHGAYRGADQLADTYARLRGLPCEPFPADWHKQGPAAGPIRNSRMLKEGRPDIVVAFKGDKGTDDMVEKAKRAGVEVIRVKGDVPKEARQPSGAYARGTRGW
ncbi:DUF2493 domain-containing protein [Burkholderia sp. Bp8990]|uniref:DUF2493 domain-containing protein n=1 Tax=Burkholderia sp. Bp8990 TaxID=2184552 RepID=UPI000F596F65|nr:DUF2493 domain-containing protein [Burkholderia sp. Bp8990]RQS39739.1 DUF2493 domain-containing protein [Burkholderia sp. Bp8990]